MIAAGQTKGFRRGKSGLHRAGCRITSGGRAHVNSIRSKTEQKAIRRPVVLSGRSLEPFGNGRPRQMITQRHNPAYRSTCAFKNRIVSYNVIFNLRRFSSAGFSQVFLCDRKLRRNSLLQKKWKLYSASTIKYQYCYKNQ